MASREYPSLQPISGFSMTGVMLVLGVVAGAAALLAVLPSVMFWLFWVLSVVGACWMFGVLVVDTFRNRHILSIPIGLLLLAYAFFAAHTYRLLFCMSGRYVVYPWMGYGVIAAQGRKPFVYAGLIAIAVVLVISVVLASARKLRTIPHLLLSIVIAAVLIGSFYLPVVMTANGQAPANYARIQASSSVQHYVVVNDTGLYLADEFTQKNVMSISTETLFFPGGEMMKLPWKSVSAGTAIISTGNTITWYGFPGSASEEFLEVAVDSDTYGYVPLDDVKLVE